METTWLIIINFIAIFLGLANGIRCVYSLEKLKSIKIMGIINLICTGICIGIVTLLIFKEVS